MVPSAAFSDNFEARDLFAFAPAEWLQFATGKKSAHSKLDQASDANPGPLYVEGQGSESSFTFCGKISMELK